MTRAHRTELARLKARLERKANPGACPVSQSVAGDGNIVAGGDLVIIDRRDGRADLRPGGKIALSEDRRSVPANPPPTPVDSDASTWARLGYLVRLLLWRGAEVLRGR